LKGLEKKDKTTMSRVASNISFLYFLENDYSEAERYVDIALNNDRYNARALVNKGNCLFMKNDFRKAKELYLEAIGVEADCIEALYNLGYVNKKLNLFIEALQVVFILFRLWKRSKPLSPSPKLSSKLPTSTKLLAELSKLSSGIRSFLPNCPTMLEF
jgi:tetratricopeptide (TPR) repeat protein